MGNIVDKVTQNSESVLSAAVTCGIFAYILNDALDKKNRRAKEL